MIVLELAWINHTVYSMLLRERTCYLLGNCFRCYALRIRYPYLIEFKKWFSFIIELCQKIFFYYVSNKKIKLILNKTWNDFQFIKIFLEITMKYWQLAPILPDSVGIIHMWLIVLSVYCCSINAKILTKIYGEQRSANTLSLLFKCRGNCVSFSIHYGATNLGPVFISHFKNTCLT